MKKKIFFLVLVILVVIQFFRPARNQSTEVSAQDITRLYIVPDTVQAILKRSCNDCHSNNTTYPWYTNIQPVGWWLQHHVDEGKAELNFSTFGAYAPKRQHHKLEETIEQVKDDHMPLNSYLWVHKDAQLSAADKQVLTEWAEKLRAEIAAKHSLSAQ